MANGSNNDDENSQAEGIQQQHEGAVGGGPAVQSSTSSNCSNNNNNTNNNNSSAHYENLYESVEPYHAIAPAQPQQQQPQNAQPYHPLAYRNELYDRGTYDVPRKQRAQQNPDINRVRYANFPRNARRQRSFDDTESYQYAPYPIDPVRYENMYERVREEEPEYQNTNRYGRLDVIGHGVGRIERHLSSSCGNIDHYSLGGHYAVLGHSHLGTVGHIRLNPGVAQNNSKDSSSAKSFFSCLGGENSQSMTNIDRAGNETTQSTPAGTYASIRPNSGAIPKQIRKQAQKQQNSRSVYDTPSTSAASASSATSAATTTANATPNQSHHNPGTLNRISKSSLQWLLVNKWLPLWAGEGPDYKIIDFNFMFSRKCDGCDEQHPGGGANQGLLRFQGQAEMRNGEMRPHIYDCIDTIPPPREYPTMNGPYPRVIRPVPQQLSRLNESSELYDRPRCRDFQARRNVFDNSAEEDAVPENYNHDPFRNWAFNFDDNTFRPAGRVGESNRAPREIRRITDGTFPKDPSPPAANPEPIPSTSRTESDSACSSQSGSVSSVVQLPVNGNSASVNVHQEQQNENTESYASNPRSNSSHSSSSNENDDDRSSIVMSDNDQ